MGVLDLLPHAVSGVYFIYHSDYEKWSFGKLSALREASLAAEKGYEYYYMGFYIHNCVKMRYKGDYKPQFILDPMSYLWHPLDGEFRSLLETKKFVSLACEPESVDSLDTPVRAENDDFHGPDGQIWKYERPADAARSEESLLSIRMPGVPTPEELIDQVDLDRLHVSLGARGIVRTEVSMKA